LYTAGGGTIPQGNAPDLGQGIHNRFNNNRGPNMENQIAVHNIDDQGNITGQTGLGRVVAQYGNIKDLNSFSPELQAAIQSYQNPKPQNYMSNLLQQAQQQGQPAPGVAAGIAGMIPAMGETRPALYDPRQRAIDEGYQPGSGFMYEGKFYESGNPGRVSMDMAPLDSLFANNPAAREAFKESGMKLVMNPNPNPQAGQQLLGPDGKPMQPFTGDASPVGGPAIDFNAPIGSPANPFGPQEGVMPELDNIGLITDAPGYNPVTPQQPTGGFDSKAFANELLTGIGDLFKQHFPESAQMAFNNSNQMQSQIEQPIQDATTFDVQPQQNMAFNPFSVNTLGGSFGGGY
jgi:hypothetical protein